MTIDDSGSMSDSADDSTAISNDSTAISDLEGYGVRLRVRNFKLLGDLIEEYSNHLKNSRARRRDTPAGITPQLVGDALGSSRYISWFGTLRNALIFAPILWTWFEIGRAAQAYEKNLDVFQARGWTLMTAWVKNFKPPEGLPDADIGSPYIDSWGSTSFGWTVGIAVALIIALVVVNVLTDELRRLERKRRVLETHEFAATLSMAELSTDHFDGNTDSMWEKISSLVPSLLKVGETLEANAKPFKDSLEQTKLAMDTMSKTVRDQVEQAKTTSEALGRIADIKDPLIALQADSAANVAALDKIQGSLTPSAEQLSSAITELTLLMKQFGQAADKLTLDFKSIAVGGEQLKEAATTLNVVAVRFSDQNAVPDPGN